MLSLLSSFLFALLFLAVFPEYFREFLTMSTETFQQIAYGILFGWTLWMKQQILKSVVLCVLEIIAIGALGPAQSSNRYYLINY